MTQLPQNEFSDFWINKLTEQQRKTRVEKAFKITRNVAYKQLELIDRYIKKENPNTLKHVYLHETIKSIWENVDFAVSLGKGKNRRFAFYPARTVMENTFRLEYFTRQKNDAQEEIATKECLRICKRHYDNEKANNEKLAILEFKKYYDKFSQGKFPDISTIKEKELDPFPSMWLLCKNSKINGGEKWYFHYKGLAEESHGKLLAISMTKQNEAQTYRLSLMYLLVMTNDVLKNADYHLGGITSELVVQAIQQAEKIVKKPL